MQQPLVTIAIPFYNDERFLSFAIQSVLNQVYTNWELLLIDDGGDDGSLQIARNYAAKDNRISVVSDGKNKGLAARLNESVLLAKGEFYARMDADDIMWKERIEQQVKYLTTNETIDVVGTSAMIIDDKNHIVRSANQEGVTTGFIHPTVMACTNWFRTNPYDEHLMRSQDLDLWFRTSSKYRFYNIPAPMLFYREFGVPSLQKNLNTHKALRSIYCKYKSYGKSLCWFIRNYSFTYVKDIIFVILSTCGQMDFIVKRRHRHPLPIEMWLHDTDLQRCITG